MACWFQVLTKSGPSTRILCGLDGQDPTVLIFLWLVRPFPCIHKLYGIDFFQGLSNFLQASTRYVKWVKIHALPEFLRVITLHHPYDGMMVHGSQRSRSTAWVLCCLDGQDLVYSLYHMLVIPFPCTHETCRNDGNTLSASDNHMVIDTITYITLRVAWWFTVLSESSNTAMVPCGLDGQNTSVAYWLCPMHIGPFSIHTQDM